jgi:hypothetical protein
MNCKLAADDHSTVVGIPAQLDKWHTPLSTPTTSLLRRKKQTRSSIPPAEK